MNGVLVLVLVAVVIVASGVTAYPSLPPDDETARYCQICQTHTMCRFPYDDPGHNCRGVEDGDLEYKEAEYLLHRHNQLRAGIGEPSFSRGPVMQLFWDDELARIARRWALQCNIYEKDECRDVGRFQVLQNVNALDLQEVPAMNRSALQRLELHLRSWYEEAVEARRDFGESQVGLVVPWLSHTGCARAIYHVEETTSEDVNDDTRDVYGDDHGYDSTELQLGNTGSGSAGRLETLVCNYGPAVPGYVVPTPPPLRVCKTLSRQYAGLCVNLQEGFSRQSQPQENRWWWPFSGSKATTTTTAVSSSTIGLLLFLLMLLLL